ncbi:hypothetical protein THMIRHAS_16850 [Thiosulfatimonas sediminis]|uniref:TIGR03750 family conjugal transfer protein n=1 Tax=Thiosulfatimonas sediminis TaxID=2675054 RepID=A0A6F8PVY6_9GAMM|nr:DUF3487 family protein [Thiosulfatimonas sediminis]BBP46312.1 hypothetical protein THMIRHAS_16850 [Thiosulfatimonas sediminis]
MNPKDEDLLVSFLDVEPVMVGGSTLPELIIILKASVLVNAVAGLILALVIPFAKPLVFGFFLVFGTFITVVVVVKWLKGHKRGKPSEYFLQWASRKMAIFNLMKPSFIDRKGHWY